jgi:hypothetical protein
MTGLFLCRSSTLDFIHAIEHMSFSSLASRRCASKENDEMNDDQHSWPPDSARSPIFRVGRNSHGDWIVQDETGRYGGIFVDRSEALKYALFENGRRHQAIVLIPDIMELDLARSS